MADNEDTTDASQKTEDPTPRKLEEARKRGQVAFSREVTNWVMLFAGTLLVIGLGPSLAANIKDTLQTFLARPHDLPTDPRGLEHMLRTVFWQIGLLMLIPFGALMLAAIFAGLAQTGAILSAEPIKPDLKKISIIAGLGRLFSKKAVAEFLKGLAKIGVVGIAIYLAISPYYDAIEHFIGLDVTQALFELLTIFIKMMIAVLLVLFVIAVADYLYQRYEFMQKMRMSKQEIKDEFKQTEGDPQIKGRLRQLREQRARQRMIQAVPEADVVITNPTHFAVALKYDVQNMDAPVMVAKGTDTVAERIKEVAREHKVPVLENPPLARALFDSMDIDEMIPAEHFKAVAEVISYVFKLKGRKL